MTNKTFSRRNFLRIAALSLGSLAFSPLTEDRKANERKHRRLVRVGSDSVSVHKQPNDESVILYQRYRDDLFNVYYEVESEHGPSYNPVWYRVWGGYLHRANVVEVDHILNNVVTDVREEGQLGEITVPYTRAMRYSSVYGWSEVYRLYYQSTHWIRDVIGGPDGKPWYELEDELLRLKYAIPAEHVRIVPDTEFSPISPDVPPEDKRIEISLSRQELTAFEDNEIVFQTNISSGRPYNDMGTPSGEFRIGSKMPSKHMGDGKVTSDIYAYELLGVPWCCFFELDNGIATHGTYWHTNYGVPMSRGCVNMRNHEAKWLFRWTNPIAEPDQWTRTGFGTRVSVV
jgi:lipoprotein-anchoring transpeptidase ErfK/SrfK